MNLLALRDVQAGYGASQVLFGVDLALREGEVATLLGRNGMGKTTTLRALFGLVPLKGGEVRFDGERIDGRATDAIARLGIALVPEGRQIFPALPLCGFGCPPGDIFQSPDVVGILFRRSAPVAQPGGFQIEFAVFAQQFQEELVGVFVRQMRHFIRKRTDGEVLRNMTD